MILGMLRQVGHPVSTWGFLPEIEVQFHHLWLYNIKEACPPASLPVSSSENRKSHICPRRWLWALWDSACNNIRWRKRWASPQAYLVESCFVFVFFSFFKNISYFQFSSVTQSCPTLQHSGLQHARPPCPSPTPGACSNSCPTSRWCHPTISSSIVPFSSRLQSFPSIRVFSNELALQIRWPKY